MEIKYKYIIELSNKEYKAFFHFLGKTSINMRKELGLSDEEAILLSSMCERLPYPEEEEE